MLRRTALRALALPACLALVRPADAQQIEFRNSVRSGDIRLAYRWLDLAGQEFNTSFALSRDAVRHAEASFRDFSMETMWRTVEAAMRDEVERFGGGVRVTFRPMASGLSWSIETRDQSAADALGRRLRERMAMSQAAYLAAHHRRRIDERRVMVDFAAATRLFQESLRPLSRALADNRAATNDRAKVAHALAFVQIIPYARLEDANRQGGDFLPAPALLAQNRGDCDSKSVALAAVLRSFVPSRKLAVITMPGHAVLAVDLPPESGERTIRTSGRSLVALEAAGPHALPVGQIGPDTDRLLGGRDVEVWPLT